MSFVPYQVDYAVKNTAKTLGFSKKRVSFKFGLASRSALQQGLHGPACRGSEHEVVFLWSLASGKRQLLLDGRDVHYSESGQNGWTSDRAWQHAFWLRDTAGGTVKCHFVSQPVDANMPDMRPFDLRINGTSYFQFNKIFQLGTPAMLVRDLGNARHASGRDSPMSPEERRQLAAAKVESMRDFREQQEKKKSSSPSHARAHTSDAIVMKREEESLISFDDDPPAAPLPPTAPPATAITATTSGGSSSNYNFASSMTMDTALQTNDSRSSSNLVSSPPPQQPTNNPYGGYNTYAQQPYGQQQYGYGQQYGQQQQQQQPPAAAMGAVAAPSSALTPYYQQQPQPQQQQPFVDATGRLGYGNPMQQQQQQQLSQAAPQYGYNSSNASSSYAAYSSAPLPSSFAPQQPPPPAAINNNPYGGGGAFGSSAISVASTGSNPYGSVNYGNAPPAPTYDQVHAAAAAAAGNPYGNAYRVASFDDASTSTAGMANTSAVPSFAVPPSQRQPSYGYPPAGPPAPASNPYGQPQSYGY